MAKDEDYLQLLDELHAYRDRLEETIEALKTSGKPPCCAECKNLWVARPDYLKHPAEN